jgi:hypothetical protein
MTIQEFDSRYGIDSSKFKRYDLGNLDNLPNEFHDFAPWVQYFGLVKQDDRQDFVDNLLPPFALEELKQELYVYEPNLAFWLGDEKTINEIGLSNLYLAFSDTVYMAEGGFW